MTPQAQEIIQNRYRLEAEIGKTRLSTVWRAVDTREGDQSVAVKFLKKETGEKVSEATLRFLREAKILGSLSHPHIVELIEVGEHADHYYLVTRYVDALPLHHHKKRFTTDEVLSIAIQIAEAIDYVHARGIIHRDLKPSNILVQNTTRPPDALVTDFGVARLHSMTSLPTQGEALTGTFAYMSPEQAGALPRPVDERTDLYALGVLFYELLSGRLPFPSDNLTQLLHAKLTQKPPDLKKIVPGLPAPFEEIVLKLMEKSPEDRYPSAVSLLADLLELRERILRGAGGESFTLATHQPLQLKAQTRLIGREEECLKIQNGIAAAARGEGSIYLIGGEAGSGKSRLAVEAGTAAKMEGDFF